MLATEKRVKKELPTQLYGGWIRGKAHRRSQVVGLDHLLQLFIQGAITCNGEVRATNQQSDAQYAGPPESPRPYLHNGTMLETPAWAAVALARRSQRA